MPPGPAPSDTAMPPNCGKPCRNCPTNIASRCSCRADARRCSMDCLEFRRRLAAEPLSRDLALHAHRGECAACAAAWERAQQAERELLDALAVPVPAGLTERILLAQATGERRQHMSRRRFALALAASLLVALAGGSLL